MSPFATAIALLLVSLSVRAQDLPDPEFIDSDGDGIDDDLFFRDGFED